jgi:hypothetical protein
LRAGGSPGGPNCHVAARLTVSNAH